jgi:hypothetical protein
MYALDRWYAIALGSRLFADIDFAMSTKLPYLQIKKYKIKKEHGTRAHAHAHRTGLHRCPLHLHLFGMHKRSTNRLMRCSAPRCCS